VNPSVTGDKDVDVIERTKKRFSITEVVRGQAVENCAAQWGKFHKI